MSASGIVDLSWNAPAVSEYNELPPALRNLSYLAFKRGLKEYLREQERAD